MVGGPFSPSFTQTSTTEEKKSTETKQKSMIERCPTGSLYQFYLSIYYVQLSLYQKKVFIMYNPLVTQNCSKHLPFLLMSESPCLLITPFHVLLSVPTCGLKLPSKTIDSSMLLFVKQHFYSKKAGIVFQRLVRTPPKFIVIVPVA